MYIFILSIYCTAGAWYFLYILGGLSKQYVDLDQTLQNVASDQGLESSPFIQQFLDASTGNKMGSCSNFRTKYGKKLGNPNIWGKYSPSTVFTLSIGTPYLFTILVQNLK